MIDTDGAALAPIETIVNFVNYLLSGGFYRLQSLPPYLVQMYHADFYVTQIENGGHSQFVHNCGTKAQTIFESAEAGLAAMGSCGTCKPGTGARRVGRHNPSKASAQTGLTGGRDPALDALDEAFSQEQAR
ncbi:DMP19 family protein [Sinorhizobium fredii]|nr:hypothetical protein [Sinorhizobium fredii]